jgi:regulator of nucleoside diphosphate kinase
MNTIESTLPAPEPRLVINFADYDRLAALADAAQARNAAVARDLLRELDRATIVPPAEFPAETVAMHSKVVFRDEQSGQAQRVTLVYPNEADIAEGRVSVLTPVGAALIGLSRGQTISWQARTGERRSLTVLAVAAPGGR